jgi:hypothetical protein
MRPGLRRRKRMKLFTHIIAVHPKASTTTPANRVLPIAFSRFCSADNSIFFSVLLSVIVILPLFYAVKFLPLM